MESCEKKLAMSDGDKGQSVARILEDLSRLAGEHRLELVAVQPRAGEADQRVLSIGPELALREILLNVRLNGRFQQVGELLSRFPHGPFIASVESLSMIKPRADSPHVATDMMVAVYLAEKPGRP